MKFIQIVEMQTSQMDEIDALEARWLAATQGKRTLLREAKAVDRDRPNTYVLIAEFPSHEAAMKNSELPETSEIAEQMAKLCDAPIVFRNLDVIEQREE